MSTYSVWVTHESHRLVSTSAQYLHISLILMPTLFFIKANDAFSLHEGNVPQTFSMLNPILSSKNM